MKTIFVAIRTAFYAVCFVLLWGWLASGVRRYDARLHIALSPAWKPVGILFMALGAILVLACLASFVLRGQGTPAPFDPPVAFVPSGPYRYVRNPMYIGAALILGGYGLWERSGAIAIFALAFLSSFTSSWSSSKSRGSKGASARATSRTGGPSTAGSPARQPRHRLRGMRTGRTSRAATLAATALLVAAAPARSSLDAVLDALEQVRAFRGAAISPDGTSVAWVERIRGRDGNENLSFIDVAAIARPVPRRLTAGTDARAHREHSAAWSPDGRSIAFLSDAAKERQLQIYVAPAAGGPARRLTGVQGQLAHLRWSPDGRTIAFLFVEGSAQEPGALVAYRPDSGVVEGTIAEQRIAVVDAAPGRVRAVSPANLYVYDYDWSPDGRSFCAEAAEGSGTNNYWIAQLYTVAADSGRGALGLEAAAPDRLPPLFPGRKVDRRHPRPHERRGLDGRRRLGRPGAGGRGEKPDAGDEGLGERALLARVGRDPVHAARRTADSGSRALDPAPERSRRSGAGRGRLAVSASPRAGRGVGGGHPVLRAAAGGLGRADRRVEAVTQRERGPDGLLGRGEEPPLGERRPARPGLAARAHELRARQAIPDGRLRPRRPVRRRALPPGPPAGTAVLPSQGYFVFLPNPRGSFGQGEAFTRANVKDFGHGDLRDILAGVDEVVRSAPVDPERVGIVGWSYGGYMTMWAVTQTNRFKAAVAGAGIVNWQSYYGQNQIDQWMIPFFGASVYDDPAVYARSSPIKFIKKVRTPTLVLHGERDSEVPTPQGYEFWHALKTLGVPTELVVYKNEGHAILRREHQRDIVRRAVAWFDRYLKRRTVGTAAE